MLLSTQLPHQADVTQAEQSKRNASASLLYARLAILGTPTNISAITRTLHNFVKEKEDIYGATLLDNNERLIAHSGGGNDALTEFRTGSNAARITIKNDGHTVGYVVLAFKHPSNLIDTVLHYFLLALMSILLASLLCALMAAHSRYVRLRSVRQQKGH